LDERPGAAGAEVVAETSQLGEGVGGHKVAGAAIRELRKLVAASGGEAAGDSGTGSCAQTRAGLGRPMIELMVEVAVEMASM
jgi:hypothetical protein